MSTQGHHTDESTMADSTLQPPPTDDDGTLASEALDDAPITQEDVAPFEIGDDEESGPVQSNDHSLPNPEELKFSQGSGRVTQGCGVMLCWMFVLFAFIIALTVGLAVGLTNNKDGSSSASGLFKGYKGPFSSVTRSQVEEAMMEYIINNGVTSSSDLSNSNSPQAIALDFLAHKDPKQLNAPLSGLNTDEGYEFISRYVMSVFHASLGGETWNYDLLFNSKHDTCDWYDVFQPPVGQVGVLCNQNTKKIVGLSFSTYNRLRYFVVLLCR